MNKVQSAYKRLSRLTALLLLMAFLVPSGLHAKAFAQYCMTGGSTSGMAEDHSCCESTSEDQASAEHHDCGWGFICACNIGQSPLSDTEWINAGHTQIIFISETGNFTPAPSANNELRKELSIRIGQHSPPLWLMYDTLLI